MITDGTRFRLTNRDELSSEQICGLVCRTLVVLAPRVTSEAAVVGHPVHTVAELQQQIHDDLRLQHPEWIVGPNGESPMCDFYEERLRQLLGTQVSDFSSELRLAV